MTKDQLLDIRTILIVYYADIKKWEIGEETRSSSVDGYLKSTNLAKELIKAIDKELE